MRTPNLGKGRRVAVLFRSCLAVIVVLTLAVGGMALNTEPVQACNCMPTPFNKTVQECEFFQQQFQCTALCTPGPVVYWWLLGNVPSWINIDGQTGLLTVCAPTGTAPISYSFQVICSEKCPCPPCGTFPNCSGCTGFSWPGCVVTINVIPPPIPGTLTIVPTFYPVAWENQPFTMKLSATGCSGIYNFSAVGLPAGLTVTDPVNGVISGIPALGTCGTHVVTVTVTDTVSQDPLCCPAVSKPFNLIVDCWDKYIGYIPPSPTGTYADDEITVKIGSGLKQGLTNVLIDGLHEAMLGGLQSETFPTEWDELHLVTVDQTVSSQQDMRFAVKGENQKVVGGTHNTAYFDYEKQFLITTGSQPPGVSQPPGTGFHDIGGTFSTTAQSPVPGPKGTKYVFKEWSGPDGSTYLNRDVGFNVNKAGPLTAKYDTYHRLILRSDYPPVEDSTWHPEGSTATWDHLALHEVPMEGLLGFLGGSLVPKDIGGGHVMDAPYTHELQWGKNYWWPTIIILLILAVIAGLGYFVIRLRAGPTRAATPKTEPPAPKRKRQQPKAKASRTTTPKTKSAAPKSKPEVKAPSRTKKAK